MAMELILLETVQGLGPVGARVRVAEGYARNYLLPRKLAAAVTPGVLRALEAKRIRLENDNAEKLTAARQAAERLGKLSVTISAQAGEDDKLYGSVGAAQILDALAKEGVSLDKAAVHLPEPIKTLGVFNVELRLHSEVEATLKVWVVRE
jgi:large subunit ribosomal protein L9